MPALGNLNLYAYFDRKTKSQNHTTIDRYQFSEARRAVLATWSPLSATLKKYNW